MMQFNRRRVAGFLTAAGALALIATISLQGSRATAKPAPPPPPPPRTFSYYDANGNPYGGLRDSYTGLVWGFRSVEWENYVVPDSAGSAQWGGAVNAAENSYADFSNAYWGRNDSDWRLPTKAEAVDAALAGFIGEMDASPEPGFQSYVDLIGYLPNNFNWTSTEKGQPFAFAVRGVTGESVLWAKATASLFIPVRGPMPP